MPESETRERIWSEASLSDPHGQRDKSVRINRMFDAVAHAYDLNNRLHSLGLDSYWRRSAANMASPVVSDYVLDAACGTGRFGDALLNAGAGGVIGVDFSMAMLRAARKRTAGDHRRHTIRGDLMKLPVADDAVDIAGIAFGIRNVTDSLKVMAELYRVLKPGGRLIILEFGYPRNRLLRAMYRCYFHQIMPRTASLLAGDRSGAYRYLPRSVETYMDCREMITRLESIGFVRCRCKALSLGIAVSYRCEKPENEACRNSGQ